MLTHTGGRAGCGVAEVILILLWTNMFHIRLRHWAISYGMGPWMSWVGAATGTRTRTSTSTRTYTTMKMKIVFLSIPRNFRNFYYSHAFREGHTMC